MKIMSPIALTVAGTTLVITFLLAPTAVAQTVTDSASLKGDSYITNRGFRFAMRRQLNPTEAKYMGYQYIDYYMGDGIAKKSFTTLAVSMPPQPDKAQYMITTTFVDCENGAAKPSAMQHYDAVWQKVGEETALKGAKWQRPVEGSMNAVSLSRACQ